MGIRDIDDDYVAHDIKMDARADDYAAVGANVVISLTLPLLSPVSIF